jgi:hypothetical protein
MYLNWDNYIIEIGAHVIDAKIAPGVDIDGEFLAFCNDHNEYIKVNGWLIDSIEKIGG